jgi:hypothetical protein
MWSEKCDSNLFFAWNCLKRFVLVIMLDHFIVSFSDHLISFLTNNACSFSIIEWRMFVLDLSNDVYDETSLMKHFIKFEKNDSLNLTKAIHQIWRKQRHFIKLDDNVISSNLKSSFHQIFEKTNDFSTFDKRSHVATRDIKNLVLQKIIFVVWDCYDK